MNFKLSTPCANCPFLANISFSLPKQRRAEIVYAVTHDQTFACHKTTTWDEDETGESISVDKHDQHCAGVLIILHKNHQLRDNWRLRMAMMLGLFDEKKLNVAAPVFETLSAFVNAENEGRG